MMAVLAPNELARLAAILARLSSSFEGERDAAAQAAARFVRDRNVSWDELLRPEPAAAVTVIDPVTRYWRHTAQECLFEHVGALSTREMEFLQSLLSRGRALSARQEAWLRAIATKTGVPQW